MKTKTVLNTVGVTMGVGSAAMLIGAAVMQPKLKKKAMKTMNVAMKRAGDLLDNVQDFLN
ncbi:MAG: hypothetical protein IJU56_09270 [Clostridia bacterium]|nr:hypothetical protein [Clostridia bacterium]